MKMKKISTEFFHIQGIVILHLEWFFSLIT